MNIWRIALCLVLGAAFCRAQETSVDSGDALNKEPLSLLKDSGASTASEAATSLAQDGKPNVESVLPSSQLPNPVAVQSPTLPSLSLTAQPQEAQDAPSETQATPAAPTATATEEQAAPAPSPTPSEQKDGVAATDPLQQAPEQSAHSAKADAAIARATRTQAQEFIRASRNLNVTKPEIEEKLSELLTRYPLASEDKSASLLITRLLRILKPQYGEDAFPDIATLVRKETARIRAEVEDAEKNEAASSAEKLQK